MRRASRYGCLPACLRAALSPRGPELNCSVTPSSRPWAAGMEHPRSVVRYPELEQAAQFARLIIAGEWMQGTRRELATCLAVAGTARFHRCTLRQTVTNARNQRPSSRRSKHGTGNIWSRRLFRPRDHTGRGPRLQAHHVQGLLRSALQVGGGPCEAMQGADWSVATACSAGGDQNRTPLRPTRSPWGARLPSAHSRFRPSAPCQLDRGSQSVKGLPALAPTAVGPLG